MCTEKTFDHCPLSIGIECAGSDGARDKFSRSNAGTRNTIVNTEFNENSYKPGGDSLPEKYFSKEINVRGDTETTKHNCEVSSQADADTSTSFIKKYPVLKRMLPEVLKSEYLKNHLAAFNDYS